ncbi:MAG: lipopolysaccharide biosynthesis protein, partial [Muribaculum sp.]|nr:lipopolysaccharide biosynthesis protein [Muribaculum sp.]
VISLYTGRVVLEALGIEDYGIYNVIGGLIAIFSFINNSMAQASQRFIAYELGAGHMRLQSVFSTGLYIHFMLALVIVILGETVGLWYVYNVAVIPADRFTAALWIYQFSILIAATTVITVPYNALIIAHERMSAFAWLSMLEVALKLVIAWVILICPFDRLVFYGMMMTVVAVLMRVAYGLYAARNFPESQFKIRPDRGCIREMGSFAGWSILGSLAAVGYTQGLNLLLNAFFNPAVNAARGVAVTVQSVLRNFSGNFQMAVNPQITKLFASGEAEGLRQLVYRASRFTGSLYLLIAVPVYIEIDTLLSLWLVEVPQYTATFIRLLLLVSMVEVLASPLNTSVQATGRIRSFEITTGVIMLLVVPLGYVVLKFTHRPELAFVVFLLQTLVAMCARLMFAHRKIGISIPRYFSHVLLRLVGVVVVGASVPLWVNMNMDQSVWRFICVTLSAVVMTGIGVFTLGFQQSERTAVVARIKNIVRF